MGKDDSSPSFAGRVGIVLAVATVVITAINGVPPFLALRGKEPYIAYEIGRSQMLYPEDADRRAIRELLSEQAIPDAFATLSLLNRGDIAAKEVVVSLSVPGRIVAEQTEPRFETKPAWVTVAKEFDQEKEPSRIRYILTNLGLARTYSLKVSYVSEPLGDAHWEVFYDGKPGVLVEDLALVPENARGISFVPTLKILGFGLLLSAIAYLAIRYREVIRQLPFLNAAKAASASLNWRRYKDSLVFELGRSELVTLCATTYGSINSPDPREFWDAVLKTSDNRIALEIHTSGQRWSGIVGDSANQQAYCLRVYAMTQATKPKLSYVVIVNDEDVWSEAPGANLPAMFAELGGNVCFAFVSGQPVEAAKRVLEVLGNSAT